MRRKSPGAGGGGTVWRDRPPKARWRGEHLECSPCGDVAGRALCGIGWPGPEVLLSLLPDVTVHYTAGRKFKPRRAVLRVGAFPRGALFNRWA